MLAYANRKEKVNNSCTKGSGILNSAINALPFELHIPGYQFCGPGTHLKKRLLLGQKGINQLDSACREHDIAYSNSKAIEERHKADKSLASTAKEIATAKDTKLGQRIAAAATWGLMNAKRKMGMGMNKKKNRKRKIRIAKRGGFIPLLPLLGVLGSLAGGAANIASAINRSKAQQKQLEELKRHNASLEGRGLYLSPYKRINGRGIRKRRKVVKKKKIIFITKNRSNYKYTIRKSM